MGEDAQVLKENAVQAQSLESVIDKIEKAFVEESDSQIFWLHSNPEDAIQEILKHFHHLQAAGGIVKNQEGDFLSIYRLNTWDLPKGKVEEGESIEQTALREVEEECGVDGLQLVRPLLKTWHGYTFKGRNIIKTTHWFEMLTQFSGDLVPQEEEDIDKVIWMNEDEFRKTMKNSYPTISLLVDNYFS